jgi:hypothetical protein
MDQPSGANVVGSRWVYQVKHDARNTIQKYRACFVAQGYSQVEGVDFFNDDTFAPVAKMSSQHACLALAAQRGYLIRQMDVCSAYLYGCLGEGETIYMQPLPAVKIDSMKPGQVLRLKVSLYGLKQSGRHWALVLCNIMASAGLQHSKHNHAVFYCHVATSDVVIISAHIDNLTIIAPNEQTMKVLISKIKERIQMKESGDLY